MRARATDFFEDSLSRKLAASDYFNFQSWYEYKHHLQATMPELCSKQCALAPTSDKMAIVIEPRRSPLMEYVVRNAAFYLDNKWRLRVYHGTENADFVREKKIQPFSLQRKKTASGPVPTSGKQPRYTTEKKKKKKKRYRQRGPAPSPGGRPQRGSLLGRLLRSRRRGRRVTAP